MDRLAYIVLPVIGGALIAAQAPINARLRGIVGSPMGSAALSFVVGTVVLVVATLAVGQGASLISLGVGPWWAYLGGICGAVFVVSTLVAAPRLGVTTTFVAVILGQVLLAALIDRFGWLGQASIPLTPERAVAIALLLVSLVLLTRRA